MFTHEFYLLPENGEVYATDPEGSVEGNTISVPDDLVLYIFDTLKWIPTMNPHNPVEWKGYGLHYHGSTVIHKTGAEVAAKIFRQWASLFQEGPVTLELTGRFEWIEGEDVSTGSYRTFSVTRESTVATFTKLAELFQLAASGDFYVLHSGI